MTGRHPTDGLLGVAVGLGEESHRHEPAEAPLAHRRTVSESRGGLEVSVGALEVSDLDVDLADPHVQVGGCARHAIAVCLGQLQRSPVEPACLTGSTGREPQSASSVVVPNPAGADTSVSLDSAPRRRRAPCLGRVTRARRSFGTYSLVAINGRAMGSHSTVHNPCPKFLPQPTRKRRMVGVCDPWRDRRGRDQPLLAVADAAAEVLMGVSSFESSVVFEC